LRQAYDYWQDQPGNYPSKGYYSQPSRRMARVHSLPRSDIDIASIRAPEAHGHQGTMVYQNQPLDLLIDVQKVGALSSTHQSQLWRELCQAEDSESSNTFHGFPNFFMDIFGQRPSIHQNTLKLESPHGASDPSVGTVRHGSKADTLIPRTEWTPALHCRAEALSVGRSMRGSIPRMCHH
jgi:hypothetical protein